MGGGISKEKKNPFEVASCSKLHRVVGSEYLYIKVFPSATDLAQYGIDNIPEHLLHLQCHNEYNLSTVRPKGP